MKTNILVNNTNMKQYIKYLCAVVLMLGMSISAWGAVIDKTNYTISTDDIDFGNLDASTPAYVAAGVIETYQEVTITLKQNVNTFVYFVANPDDYYITGYSDASTYFVGSATGSYTIRVYTYFELDNGTHTHTLYFFMGAESEEISVTATVINACTPNDIAYDHSGTGGNDPTGDATACEDATVSFTPDPSTGYEYSGATVYLSDMETVHASLNSSTTSFTMPDEDVYVVATYAPVDYTISFNANGGTGLMGSVERAYNSTYELPACTFTAPAGKVFKCWAEGSAGGTERAVGYSHTVAGDITFYAKWRDGSYTDYVFSCAELTLTPHLVTASTPIFITSVANKKVRSQDYIEITGSGLTPNTTLTFPGLDSKFEVLTATGGTISTDASGAISVNAYIFYTPAADASTDGLDQMAGLTVSVSGAKPKQASLVQSIIGRHLPADFVIAGKKDGKWYAMPSNMASTTNPKPSEIAVDDFNNPSVAYTATSNIYGLEGPTTSGGGNNISSGNGQYVRLTMSIDDGTLDPHAAPLFGQSTGSNVIGKSGNSQASSHLSAGWWWALTQTNTSITNPQDAKYTIKCANNTSTLSLRDNAGNPDWGLFASGVEELRLIPASDITFTEAYFVEWSQHGGVVEVDAEGIDATSVVAHLNGESSSAITLVQTKASDAKNKSSKYNYTVNFGGSIDFAAAASNGALLTLEWKNGETVKAMSNIVVPKIVASNITINKANYPLKSDWNTEVHVLPGKTVTVDPSAYDGSNVTIKELNIYPGATVVASTGTLIATTLVLRNGWSRAGEKTYDVARLYVTPSTSTLKATNVYADWYIDYDQYYPIAVPWKVTTSGITYLNTSNAARGGVKMRYYDGEGRANGTNGSAADGANWLEYSRVVEGKTYNYPETLNPGKGYAMTARRPTGKAFSIVRLPLTLPSGTWGEGSWTTNGEAGTIGAAPSDVHKDTVYVHAWGVDDESKPRYAVGWNFIANPYMSIYQGPITHSEGSSYNVEFVTIPDTEFKEYDQYPVGVAAGKGEKLLPASGFFIQTAKDGTLTFGTGNRQAAAPSFRNEVQNLTNKQKAYIVLNDEENEDMMGLLVSDLYTADYDINGDLEKLMGEANSLKTYMRYNEMNMAYVAINEELAREWIPITVRIPENGEYTYSLHEASIADELEGVYLIDYQNGNVITNLLDNSYTFYSPSGIISGRFAINAIVGMHDTPTDVDIINAGGDIHSDKPVKFIYRDKVYILSRGVIYDSTGKKVREINK